MHGRQVAWRAPTVAAVAFCAAGEAWSDSGVVREPPRSGVVELAPPSSATADGASAGGGGNVNVTRNDRAQNETTIAADPRNPFNLVAGTNDYRFGDSDAGLAYSSDGGSTWAATTLDAVNGALGKYDAQGDPAVAAYRDRVFYYAYIDFNRGDDRNRLCVAKSPNGGVSWPQLGVIIDHSGGGEQDFEDKEYIAVDNTGGRRDGNVYVSWTRFPAVGSTRIMFSRSIDGGVSFSGPIQISDDTAGYQGSVPAVGPGGEVYVVWYRTNGRIEIDKSTNGGVSWGPDRLVGTVDRIPSPLPGAGYRTNSFPTIAVDRTTGNVYVAWADDRGPDVVLSRSTDGGASWSAPVTVSDDVNGSYQFFPWISVGPGGAIDVVFFDRRLHPGSVLYHTFLARSTDGGLSFRPNELVSDEVSNSQDDGFGGTFIGDYNGIVSTANGSNPFWTDVRATTGNAEGFTASLGFPCLEDVDGDGNVGFPDIVRVLAAWGPYAPCPPYAAEDVNQDCLVGILDVIGILANWGPCG